MTGLPANVYELIALSLRYWLVFLAVMILWRAYRLMKKNNREYRKTMRKLPDAGLVGELVDLETGIAHPLPKEGMVGSGRASDIRLAGISRRALELAFRSGFGLRLIPSHSRHAMRLDGSPISRGGDYALHGSVLEIGERAYRFRLFEGLDVPEREAVMPLDAPLTEMSEEVDLWSQQMVMDPPPPLPPGEDDFIVPVSPWPYPGEEELPHERQAFSMPPPEQAVQEPPPFWHEAQGWEDQDEY